MRLRYKLKDTMYSVREHFSKEAVERRKKVWDQVKRLREVGKYAVIKYDKIFNLDGSMCFSELWFYFSG